MARAGRPRRAALAGAVDFAAEDLVGDEVLGRERACPLFDSRDSLGVPSSAWSTPPPGLAAVLDQTHDDVALGLVPLLSAPRIARRTGTDMIRWLITSSSSMGGTSIPSAL
jgi:hypothetical protein